MEVPSTIRTREQVAELVDEIVACNPGSDAENMMRGATFNADGDLEKW